MRISSDENDPGFRAYKRLMKPPGPDTTVSVRVYLDGAVVKDVVTADDEECMLVRYCRAPNGDLVVDGDEIRTEMLRGRVDIECVVRWDRWTPTRA